MTALVQDDVLSDEANLPEWAPLRGGRTYLLEWYEVVGGQRGVVISTQQWSASVGVYPGERWSDVIRRAKDNYELRVEEYGQ